MITEEEAKQLVEKYLNLKSNYDENKTLESLKKLRQHEHICVKKLEYLVKMATARYRKFSNYDDLYQEGMLCLFHSMTTFDVSKNASFFWWAHRYIQTKVKRCANQHTTIRISMKDAKKHTPHKEFVMPILIEETYCPDKMAESFEEVALIRKSLNCLTKNQEIVIRMVYGIGLEDSFPINKICATLNISRVQCNNVIKSAMSKIKNNIVSGKRMK